MIKNVCVVDDGESKRAAIVEYLKKLCLGCEIGEMKCVSELKKYVLSKHDEIKKHPEEWLMVLDMQMPIGSAAWASIEIDGGIQALRILQAWELTCPAIIVSSETINEGRAAEAYSYYKGFIKYKAWTDLTEEFRKVLVEHLD